MIQKPKRLILHIPVDGDLTNLRKEVYPPTGFSMDYFTHCEIGQLIRCRFRYSAEDGKAHTLSRIALAFDCEE